MILQTKVLNNTLSMILMFDRARSPEPCDIASGCNWGTCSGVIILSYIYWVVKYKARGLGRGSERGSGRGSGIKIENGKNLIGRDGKIKA